VLVSGFTTATPFSTSDPSCAGKEGDTWSASVAPALKAAGYTVFTAPEGDDNANPSNPGPPPPACLGTGQIAPPGAMTINTGGDVDENGQRLAQFLGFLNQSYGITNVQLVGHSDGGIWSRAALSQPSNFPGVTVSSLTTLGTPHEGSFVADLALGVDGLDCKSPSNPVIRLLCSGVQEVEQIVSDELGPTALNELTSSYMATWNHAQTTGGCPVTTIAGTYVQAPSWISWLIPDYYNPSDTVVGQSSALATKSTLVNFSTVNPPNFPNHVSGGSFPVVHSSSLSFITPDNLLNQADITSVVGSAVSTGAGNTTPCAQGPAAPASASFRRASGAQAESTTLRAAPMSALGLADPTRLPPTRKRDFVVAKRGTTVRCGSAVLDDDAASIGGAIFAPAPNCARPRVSGGRAVVLRYDAHRRVVVRYDGGRGVTVRATGAHVRKLEAEADTGRGYRRLHLDRRGNATLPRDDDATKVRALLTVRRSAPRESAVFVLDR
jgi:triacylglycerol lipase